MNEDWIARGIAGVAALAAIVNSIISYRKLKFDQLVALPEVGWIVKRVDVRTVEVIATVTNSKNYPICAKAFAIGSPKGAKIVTPIQVIKGAPANAQGIQNGTIDPGASQRFPWRFVIANDFPAPFPVEVLGVLTVDLGGPDSREHRFRFNRSV